MILLMQRITWFSKNTPEKKELLPKVEVPEDC